MLQETQNPQGQKLWDEVRETVVAGLKDWKEKGDEVARYSRIRMDEFQSERRLRAAHKALGEKCHELLSRGETITTDHPVINQFHQRVHYYQDELARLHSERTTNVPT